MGLTRTFWVDLLNGVFVAVGTAVFGAIYEIIQVVVANKMDFSCFDWKVVAGAAVLALFGYLQKKLFTNTNGEPYGIKIR